MGVKSVSFILSHWQGRVKLGHSPFLLEIGIDTFNYYTLFMTPMFLFSGIFFPIESFPPLVAKIAFFTPLYHLVNISRSFANSSIPAGDILWLLAATAIIAPYPFQAHAEEDFKGVTCRIKRHFHP